VRVGVHTDHASDHDQIERWTARPGTRTRSAQRPGERSSAPVANRNAEPKHSADRPVRVGRCNGIGKRIEAGRAAVRALMDISTTLLVRSLRQLKDSIRASRMLKLSRALEPPARLKCLRQLEHFPWLLRCLRAPLLLLPITVCRLRGGNRVGDQPAAKKISTGREEQYSPSNCTDRGSALRRPRQDVTHA
jgi:hypothetical protein